jgi:hypothetical protein
MHPSSTVKTEADWSETVDTTYQTLEAGVFLHLPDQTGGKFLRDKGTHLSDYIITAQTTYNIMCKVSISVGALTFQIN